MIEHGYTRTSVITRLRRGPLGPHLDALATTLHQHRPKSHQAHLEWTPSKLVAWGATIGPSVAELIRTRLRRFPFLPPLCICT